MAGYTPLFSSLTTGTLCGRWPDIGLWPIVLSLSDRHGIVDVTPAYIAGITGLAIDDVVSCMARFCQPDPYSRSPAEKGARLVLLDEHREWGWRIVNHERYREKARKAAYDADRTASGKDRERKAESRAVPRCPDTSRVIPLSDSDSDSDSDKNKKNPKNLLDATRPTRKKVSREAEDSEFLELKLAYPERSGDYRWKQARSACNARIAEGHTWRELVDGAKRYAEFSRACGKFGTEYVMQAVRFCGSDKPFLLPWKPPPKAETASERILRLNGGDNSRIIEHEPDTPKFLESH